MSAVPFDQTIGERQAATYANRWHRPSAKNRGPKGTSSVGKGAVKLYYVVVDTRPPGGLVCDGRAYPDGTSLRGVPILPRLHSRQQARKALARVRKRRPEAYRVTWQGTPDREFWPTFIELPAGVRWNDLPPAG